MKKLALILLLGTSLALFPAAANADPVINFGGGNISFSQIASNIAGVSFSSVAPGPTILTNQAGTVTNMDALAGSPVDLIPGSGGLEFSTTTGQFLSGANTATLNISGGSAGTASATVQFLDVTGGSGSFTIQFMLSGVTGLSGNSTLLDAFLQNSQGSGILTFQFAGGGVNSLADLLTASPTSLSGSVTTPEPSSLALLAIGMLLLGGIAVSRRRFAPAGARA